MSVLWIRRFHAILWRQNRSREAVLLTFTLGHMFGTWQERELEGGSAQLQKSLCLHLSEPASSSVIPSLED